MLGFILSTIAFSIALQALNRHFGVEHEDKASSKKATVIVIATLFSLGVGWTTDKLDGDADKPQKSIAEVVKSGDPLLIAKMLIGIS